MHEALLLEFRKRVFEENYNRIRICLNRLDEEQIWYKPNMVSNSVANLILHLIGNVRQWICTGLGSLPDSRKRDLEFEMQHSVTKDQLFLDLSNLQVEVDNVLDNLAKDIWLEKRKVQVFEETGLSILIHVIEHFSYHTGQIAWITKALEGKDLGFYKDMDLG